MKSFVIIYLIFLILMVGLVSAVDTSKNYEITLLSVSEMGDGELVGGLAYLDLKLKPGSGAVFLESYPATKIDTQVSTRVANEIACSYSKTDCSKYDFFYTIRAEASTIGGPSAGGAISLITLSALESEPLKEKLAMTGAISSGGILMPVDGIYQKVTAAQDKDYNLVLVPKLAFTDKIKNVTNESSFRSGISRSEFANFSINIEEVYSIKEAFEKATINNYKFKEEPEIIVPMEYGERMRTTSDSLCLRSTDLFNQTRESNSSFMKDAKRFYNLSIKSNEKKQYYSRASFCYSANVNLRNIFLENLNQDALEINYLNLMKSYKDFEKTTDAYVLETFSDLETYSIVKERLLESKSYLDEINQTNISTNILAAAIERYYSAVVWSGFFGMKGEKLDLNPLAIQNACQQEMQNVNTRLSYLQTFLPKYYLSDLRLELNGASDYAQKGEYELCLFKSLKAKANADYLVTASFLYNDTLIDLVHEKQNVASTLIAKQQENNVFPILGFSYLEYSKALEKDSYYSALMFAEYAIAFSDVSGYFKSLSVRTTSVFNFKRVEIFLAGILVGILLGFLLFNNCLGNSISKTKSHSKSKKHKKRK